jgi:hypothetical protein
MTVAPLVANGVVIRGELRAPNTASAVISGLDAQTGKVALAHLYDPREGAARLRDPPGDTWKQGGGST